MSAPNPTTHQSDHIYALFDTDRGWGAHYRFDLDWTLWTYIDAPLPCEPNRMGRLAYDPELESLYATVGGNTNLFYARCAGSGGEVLGGRTSGAQAGAGSREGHGLVAARSGDGLLVRYALPMPQRTCLDAFDPTGRKVLSRDAGVQAAGEHTLRVSATELAARGLAPHGVLLIRLTHGSTIEHAKVVFF